jgi:putative membrane protein
MQGNAVEPLELLDANDNRWQRLAPMALLYLFFDNLKGAVQGLVYLIPAAALSLNTLKQYTEHWVFGVLGIFLLFTMATLVKYYFFQFKLSAQNVEVKSGVLSRSHINLPFERIQNIKLEQPLYYRLSDHVVMILDTAGSTKEEAKIIALPRHYAEYFKNYINAYRQQELAPQSLDEAASSHDLPQKPSPSSVTEKVINQRSLRDLVLHGITNNRMWILLGVLAPVYNSIFSEISDFFERRGLSLETLFDAQTMAWWQLGLAAMSIMLAVFLVMALASILGAVIMFYGFTLSKQGSRYIRRCGLFTQREVSMQVSRVQMLKGTQDWLDCILHRVNLIFAQNSNGQNEKQQLMSHNKLIVPSVKVSEAALLVRDLWPNNKLYSVSFEPIHRRFVNHACWLYLLPCCVLLALMSFLTNEYSVLAYGGVVVVLAVALIFLRWRRWGFALDDEYIYVRNGLLGQTLSSFPRYKVQQVIVKQSYRMRQRQLATLVFVLASGDVTIPFIRQSQALNIANKVIYSVEGSLKSWM